MEFITVIGIGASALTASSLVPQLAKIVRERRADNVSLAMLVVLLSGLALWIYYGILKEDVIIIVSNAFAFAVNLLTLVLTIYYKKKKSH